METLEFAKPAGLLIVITLGLLVTVSSPKYPVSDVLQVLSVVLIAAGALVAWRTVTKWTC